MRGSRRRSAWIDDSAGAGGDIRGEGVVRDRGDRGGDARAAGEHGLDLAELDAVAAHLDLVVVPAEELEGAVRPASGRGRRCDTSVRRRRAERVGHEALGGQLGPVQVAERDAGAADDSSPGTPTGTGRIRSSSNVDPVLAIGPPIGDGRRALGLRRSYVDQIVVSVGPYMLASRPTMPRAPRRGSTGNASPPNSAAARRLVEAGREQHPPARRGAPARR